jgi:O-antigen/teichoic acid export membrane protein
VAYLLSNLVNYGTNQTSIKNVAVANCNSIELSKIFSKVFWLRLVVFVTITTITTIITITTSYKKAFLWLSILPIILAEIANPFYFLVSVEKMHWISWGNVIIRALGFLLVLFLTIHSNQSIILNLLVGVPLLFFNLFLSLYVIRSFQLKINRPNIEDLRVKLFDNFQVTFNGNIGLLQQSIFLFFVGGNFNASILGAYGIVDKLLNAIRQIVSAFSTAICPRAAQLYHESKSSWLIFRSHIQQLYFISSVLLGIFLYYFADQIVFLISNEENHLASNFIQLLSLAPLFLSLNANNVLDFLLNEHYKGMFNVSIFILLATVLISFVLTSNIFNLSIGWYPLFIEANCFLIYSVAVKKYKLHAI